METLNSFSETDLGKTFYSHTGGNRYQFTSYKTYGSMDAYAASLSNQDGVIRSWKSDYIPELSEYIKTYIKYHPELAEVQLTNKRPASSTLTAEEDPHTFEEGIHSSFDEWGYLKGYPGRPWQYKRYGEVEEAISDKDNLYVNDYGTIITIPLNGRDPESVIFEDREADMIYSSSGEKKTHRETINPVTTPAWQTSRV